MAGAGRSAGVTLESGTGTDVEPNQAHISLGAELESETGLVMWIGPAAVGSDVTTPRAPAIRQALTPRLEQRRGRSSIKHYILRRCRRKATNLSVRLYQTERFISPLFYTFYFKCLACRDYRVSRSIRLRPFCFRTRVEVAASTGKTSEDQGPSCDTKRWFGNYARAREVRGQTCHHSSCVSLTSQLIVVNLQFLSNIPSPQQLCIIHQSADSCQLTVPVKHTVTTAAVYHSPVS
ncbi:hypothetical protein J6590_043803 [Homalodisca vitripennis]|nr:hypothetical protein J6590_043803 [Homalodisca vitripennis]